MHHTQRSINSQFEMLWHAKMKMTASGWQILQLHLWKLVVEGQKSLELTRHSYPFYLISKERSLPPLGFHVHSSSPLGTVQKEAGFHQKRTDSGFELRPQCLCPTGHRQLQDSAPLRVRSGKNGAGGELGPLSGTQFFHVQHRGDMSTHR